MVDYADKIVQNRPLHGMFTAIPRRYDLVNHVITWGLDKRWRWEAARECLASQPRSVRDAHHGRLIATSLSLIEGETNRPGQPIAE